MSYLLCCLSCRAQIQPLRKMWSNSKMLLVSEDMNGRQHSATGVLPHPFHIQMRFHKLWVANCSLGSTSSSCCAATAVGLYFFGAKMWIHSKALLASKDMDGRQHSATGGLPHPFHTQMSLHKLWKQCKFNPCFRPQLPGPHRC